MASLTNLEIQETLPKTWFLAKGSGNSDFGHEGGSKPEAFLDAGIGNCNIIDIGYSIPTHSREIPIPKIDTGCIMPAIISIAHGRQGDIISAGIAFAKLRNIDTGAFEDALLCKNTYSESNQYTRTKLLDQLNDLYFRRYDSDCYELAHIRMIIQETFVSKKFGTAIVAVCFKALSYPVSGL